jgi:hypothetical protein
MNHIKQQQIMNESNGKLFYHVEQIFDGEGINNGNASANGLLRNSKQ